jgi:hypothetical protein
MERTDLERTGGLREQAGKFRELAATDHNGIIRDKLLAIATQCDQLATSIEASAVARRRLRLVSSNEEPA